MWFRLKWIVSQKISFLYEIIQILFMITFHRFTFHSFEIITSIWYHIDENSNRCWWSNLFDHSRNIFDIWGHCFEILIAFKVLFNAKSDPKTKKTRFKLLSLCYLSSISMNILFVQKGKKYMKRGKTEI